MKALFTNDQFSFSHSAKSSLNIIKVTIVMSVFSAIASTQPSWSQTIPDTIQATQPSTQTSVRQPLNVAQLGGIGLRNCFRVQSLPGNPQTCEFTILQSSAGTLTLHRSETTQQVKDSVNADTQLRLDGWRAEVSPRFGSFVSGAFSGWGSTENRWNL